MISKHKYDILGYFCEFKRCYFYTGTYQNQLRKDEKCYAVFLNGFFIGTIHTICGHGEQLVSVLPDDSVKLYRGYSRPEAVKAYILDNLL